VYGDLGLYRTEERATRWELVDFPAGIDENIPLDPHSPYGCSKATGEAYALDYARVYGLKTVSLRQSCIYGPRQFGIEDQGWVAWFALAAALGRQITIFGDGKQVRDLLYVDDLVELYLEAAERAVDCAGRAYNVGGGAGNTLSLVELIEILEERYGALEPRFAPLRAGDQRVFVADSGRAAADLGWRPTTPVASGLDQLLEWVGEHAEPARALLTAG
jgi:CDP-paratose 2-epimerase